MKNSPLITFLVAALLLSALASLVLFWLYVGKTREMRSLQAMANQVNYFRQVSSALAGDAVEYGKTHPAINPILESTIPNFKAMTSTNGTKNGAK
jgi:hypothetical protein